jgi:hypothetical protein
MKLRITYDQFCAASPQVQRGLQRYEWEYERTHKSDGTLDRHQPMVGIGHMIEILGDDYLQAVTADVYPTPANQLCDRLWELTQAKLDHDRQSRNPTS